MGIAGGSWLGYRIQRQGQPLTGFDMGLARAANGYAGRWSQYHADTQCGDALCRQVFVSKNQALNEFFNEDQIYHVTGVFRSIAELSGLPGIKFVHGEDSECAGNVAYVLNENNMSQHGSQFPFPVGGTDGVQIFLVRTVL